MKGMAMEDHKPDPPKADTPISANMPMPEAGMDIVHPFFTHMGMPDPPGQYVLRLSGVSAREDGRTRSDFGFHLETGLSKRFGLHIRNDRVATNAHTEIMFQYAAIRSQDGMSGLSPFVEVEIPTHNNENHTYGLVGFSSTWSGHKFEVNQSLEYSPRENALEGSISLVGQVGRRLFPVVEYVLAEEKGTTSKNSVIVGPKYRVNKSTVVGLGYQFPVTMSRDFTHQVLLQTDLEW